MTKELFIFKELLRSLPARTWVLALVIVVAVAIFLGVVALVSFLLQPAAPGMGARLIAVPRDDLSQSDLSSLHERLLSDPEVVHVRFVFSSTATNRSTDEQQRTPSRFEIVLRSDAELASVSERLRGWGAFRQVGPPGPDSLETWRDWLQNPETRWFALAGFLLLLAMTLLVIYGGLIASQRNFAGELELLELSGVSPQTLRIPFVLLGALYGLAGALLVGYLLDGLRALLEFSSLWLPEPWERDVIDQLGVRGFLFGLALSGVAGILGWLSAQKYPSPFKRSRISSSSADVTEG